MITTIIAIVVMTPRMLARDLGAPEVSEVLEVQMVVQDLLDRPTALQAHRDLKVHKVSQV